MAAIDDLKNAVTRLTASVSAELNAISATLAGSPSNADVALAASSLGGLADKLDAETATLTGTTPTPPPPPPVG